MPLVLVGLPPLVVFFSASMESLNASLVWEFLTHLLLSKLVSCRFYLWLKEYCRRYAGARHGQHETFILKRNECPHPNELVDRRVGTLNPVKESIEFLHTVSRKFIRNAVFRS